MGSELSSTLEPETEAAGGRPLPLSSRYIRLGPFQVDRHRQEVTKNAARLNLRGKVYQQNPSATDVGFSRAQEIIECDISNGALFLAQR